MLYWGTSGFSYDDWKGHFYPDRIGKKDMLCYYTRLFNAVEINSTYYAIPGAKSFYGMAVKTPEHFRFVVKAHRDMTHSTDSDSRSFDSFIGAITPLQEAGKLGCILAQFPWSFKRTKENEIRLREFREKIESLPAVVEFRNADWVVSDTFHLLRELNFGFCCVDEPELKGLMPKVTATTSDVGYVRFHGRNAKDWWQHEQAYQRYNYLYSGEELAEWVPRVKEIGERAKDIYLFFNNHYQGKSAQNAKMFASMLGVSVPEALETIGEQLTLGG